MAVPYSMGPCGLPSCLAIAKHYINYVGDMLDDSVASLSEFALFAKNVETLPQRPRLLEPIVGELSNFSLEDCDDMKQSVIVSKEIE